MSRRVRNVPHAVTQDGPFLAALLDTLDDLYDLIDARLPKQQGVEEPDPNTTGGPVRLTEPAGPSPAPLTEPATTPAPPVKPKRAGQKTSKPASSRASSQQKEQP